jgi:hypothetical protein
MKYLFLIFIVSLSVSSAFSQSKSNDAISKQIKTLKADKTFNLTFDKGSGMSKLMATSDNFAEADAKKAGIQAMSFGMAFFYQGQALSTAADPMALTFWVMTKKPQFAATHKWSATIGSETLDLGDAQYAAKPGDNMEYLNFKISRADLAKIAAANGKIKLGAADFQFTPEHLKLFSDILKLSDPAL